jgi:hypothetical protein
MVKSGASDADYSSNDRVSRMTGNGSHCALFFAIAVALTYQRASEMTPSEMFCMRKERPAATKMSSRRESLERANAAITQ